MTVYRIRKATDRDLPSLPAIEQAACMLFLETRYAALAEHPNASEHIDTAHDRVWVATYQDVPIGFAMARVHGDTVHLCELHIHPNFSRRGLGSQLIDHVAAWARTQNAISLTLTTFADIAWNGPYYSRLGFTTVARPELSEHLRVILQAEAAVGVPMEHRIAMRRDLWA
ncbi:MAG TPA: GNAT family N-acetyltransferase [Steroidobacteraceae bacterium]|jgi:GNAT superfamily N-acetyltransferase|nr:GNAT family N-acetyltransferase [Steroidobacteraceae bacterium]